MTIRLWNGQIDVNTITSITQSAPDVAVLSDGRFVIVWEDNSTGTNRIMQRVFSADGSPATEDFVAIEEVVGRVHPVVTATDNGGWVVSAAVSSGNTGGFVSFTANGAIATSSPTTFSNTSDLAHFDSFQVGSDIWIMEPDTGSNNQIDVFRYTVNANDTLSFISSFTAQETTTGAQVNPAGAQISNSNVVLTWREGTNIEFRIVSNTGTQVLGDTVATVAGSDATSGSYGKPHVLALENGGFLITWSDGNSSFPGAGFDVWGRIYAPDGTAFNSAPFLINSNVSENQFSPVSVPLKTGGFATFWNTNVGANEDAKGQLFDNLGNKIGQEFQVNGPGNNANLDPDSIDADVLDDGRIVVTWSEVSRDENGTSEGIVAQIIDPRDGNIFGDSNDNFIFGNDTDDDIFGADGSDTIYGLEGRDVIFGGNSNDTLVGGDGDDSLIGGNSDDVLFGNDGNDNLDGGAGNDQIIGGAGNDMVFGGAGGDAITGDEGDDNLSGNAGNDTIFGDNFGVTAGNDAINGGAGNDTLSGFGGNDVIYGGADGDNIDGGAGNDTLQGEGGDDFITGGADADTFQFLTNGFNADTITDFQVGTDKLQISTSVFADFAALQAASIAFGSGTAIFGPTAGDIINLENVTFGTLTSGDVLFV